MERVVTFRRFDIGEPIENVDVEAEGNKWLLYWLEGQDVASCFMTDGRDYVSLPDPDEWYRTYTRAIVLAANPAQATDMTCERVKQALQQRGDWQVLT